MLEMICPRPCDWSVPVELSVCGRRRSCLLKCPTLFQDDDGGCLAPEGHDGGGEAASVGFRDSFEVVSDCRWLY